MKTVPGLLALTALLALAPAVRADQSDEPRAQALFLDGRAALEKGDFPTACARFAESLRLVSRASTLLNLAQCEQHEGRLVKASEHWRQGIALLPPTDERFTISKERAAALDARLPHLIVTVVGAQPSGLQIEIDGVAVLPADAARGLPADPGEHTIVLRIPGSAAQTTPIALHEGETRTLSLSIATTAAAKPPPAQVAPTPSARSTHTGAYIAGGVGAAGLVLGGVMGALTFAAKGTVDQHCGIGGDPGACDRDGKQAADRMKTFGVVSLAALSLGAAGVGTGTVLLLTGPAPTKANAGPGVGSRSDVSIGAAGTTLFLRAHF